MFSTTLILLFLLRIRFPKEKPISNILTTRYGPLSLQYFRKYEGTYRKKTKAEMDLEFLHSCKAYHVVPKFLGFKLYRKSLYSTQLYKDFKCDLLDNEIDFKSSTVKKLTLELKTHQVTFRNSVSHLDYAALNLYLSKSDLKLRSKISDTHSKKIENLGGKLKLTSCPPSQTIFNYSSRILSKREEFLLSFGLDFKLPIYRPSFHKFFLACENFFSSVRKLSIDSSKLNLIQDRIRTTAKFFFHSYNSSKVFSPIFRKPDFNLLKELSKGPSTLSCNPMQLFVAPGCIKCGRSVQL